jgi:hypothetical protein
MVAESSDERWATLQATTSAEALVVEGLRGAYSEVIERAREPILATTNVESFEKAIAAVDHTAERNSDTPVRILTPKSATERVAWPQRHRAVELQREGVLAVRCSSPQKWRGGDLAARNRFVTAEIPRRHLLTVTERSRTSDTEVNLWDTQWSDGTTVDLGNCGREELIEATNEYIGNEAAQILREGGRKHEYVRPRPELLLLWAAALSNAKFADVVTIAERTGLCEEETLRTHLSWLEEQEAVIEDEVLTMQISLTEPLPMLALDAFQRNHDD